MQLDTITLMVATAVVVIVGGSSFLVETVWHWDSRSARLWSLAFLSAITSTFAFIVWAVIESGWIALVIGNATFTAVVGFLFLGCRSFNGRTLRTAAWSVFVVCLAIVISALVEGEGEAGWGGSLIRFIGTAIFAVLGAIETRRGALARRPASAALTFAFALASLYYLGRASAFVLLAPDDPLFQTWFGTPAASIVTISLVVIALGSLSVLRAIESNEGGVRTLELSDAKLLTSQSFESVIDHLLERAEGLGEDYAIIALRIEDLAHIATAFGRSEAEAARESWRRTVLASAPLSAVMGEKDATSILLGVPVTSAADLQRMASRVQLRVSDSFLDSAVVPPVIGVGVATMSGTKGQAAALIEAADEAARESVDSPDGSLVYRG